MRHTVTLPYPPSANRYWKIWRNRAVLSAEARAYKRTVAQELRKQGVPLLPKPLELGVRLFVYRPQKSGDLTNRFKVPEDALNKVLWEDDNQIVEFHGYRREDPANPRVEVMVWVVGEPKVQGRLGL